MQPITDPRSLRAEERKTYPSLSRVCDIIMDVCLHGAIFLIPLLFSSITLDALELVKQTALIAFATVGVVAWLGKAVAEKSLSIHRSWLHIVVTLFVIVYGILSALSTDPYQSMVGLLGQMPWSFVTILSLYGLYFVAVNRLRDMAQVYDLLFTFLLSSLLAGLYGVLQAMGWYVLPSAISKAQTFSTVGSIFSLSVYMVVPVVVAASLAFHGCRNNVCLLGSPKPLGLAARGVVWLNIIVGTLLLVFTDYWVAWVALLFGTVLTVVLGLIRERKVGRPVMLILPAILVIISGLLLWQPTPFALQLPAEVAPSAPASWNIAQQALRDHPVFGTGPGTWTNNYARYRDRLVNGSAFWNIRFDRSFSQFLTLLATIGILGIATWFVMLASVIVKSAAHLLKEKNDDAWYAMLTVFSGWATLTFLTFFYNFNVSHLVVSWLLLALVAVLAGGSRLTWDQARSKYAFETITTLFVLCAIVGFTVLWLVGQRFMADVSFSKGVSAFRSGQPMDQVIPMLEKATRLNPRVDMYLRNLSQAHLIKAANLIQAKPTQEQAAVIQQEIKSAVDLGMAASNTNPGNVDNFSNLAVIYQSIASFTRGADEFAIATYNEAIRREPYNPAFIAEVGKLYLLRSDAFRTQINDADPAKAAAAKKSADENVTTAEEVLKRAIEAKPDYLPARYYLGIVYERQARLKDSIAQLATVLQQNPNDTGVEFELSLLLYRDNQRATSLTLMEEVVRRDATNANARWYLSAMYEEQGKTKEAIDQLKELAKQFPDNTAVKQRLAALEANENPKGLPEPVAEPIQGPGTNPVQR